MRVEDNTLSASRILFAFCSFQIREQIKRIKYLSKDNLKQMKDSANGTIIHF